MQIKLKLKKICRLIESITYQKIRYGSGVPEKKAKERCLLVDKRAEKMCLSIFVAFNLAYWICLLTPKEPKKLAFQ